ncbi:hypothetical protein D9M72_295390 [compost metagenome]
MNADGPDLHRQQGAFDGLHTARLDHSQHTRGHFLGLMQDRTGQFAGDQATVGGIGPVGEDLRACAHAEFFRDACGMAIGIREQNQCAIHRSNGSHDGTGHAGVDLREVAQCTMRLHVGDRMTRELCHAHGGTDLVGDELLDLGLGRWQLPTAEPPEIGIAGMGPHRDAQFLGACEGPRHDMGVSCVHPASDVRGTDDFEDRVVVAHLPGAEAFAQVGVQVDRSRDACRIHGRFLSR